MANTNGADPLDAWQKRVLAKVTWRLIPFLFLLYIAAFLTRINVNFASLQMNDALGFDDAIYGIGAGIFFFGYFIFEVPGNLILERIGARQWIASIMFAWGCISCAMMFVYDPLSFYVLRFLLGLTQAAFFPGMILYLTYWFPAAHRARAVAKFMTAAAVANIVGGPVSGYLLSWNGTLGLAGWQWLFLIEGLPSVVLGVAAYFVMTDRPEMAHWLNQEERDWLVGELRQEQHAVPHHGLAMFQSLLDLRVALLCVIYLGLALTVYGLGFWLPKILDQIPGRSDLQIGLLSAIPYVVAAVAMVIVGMHSDRTGERRWHLALSAMAGGLGFALSVLIADSLWQLAGLCLAAVGLWSTLGPFWTLPTGFLRGTSAAAGIALINAVGNLGGFFGNYLMGQISTRTGSLAGGIWMLAGTLFAAGLLALLVRRRRDD